MALALMAMLLAGTSSGLTLGPAPGHAFPPPREVFIGGQPVELDDGGRGRAPSGGEPSLDGFRFYCLTGSERERRCRYFPSDFSLMKWPVEGKRLPSHARLVAKAHGQSWATASSFDVERESTDGKSCFRFALPRGRWDLGLLVDGDAPAFDLGVAPSGAALTLPATALRWGGGLRARIRDPETGHAPDHWKAFVRNLHDDGNRTEAEFFGERPVAADEPSLSFLSLSPGLWEVRVETPSYSRNRVVSPPIAPGAVVNLGDIFLSSPGALRLDLTFLAELPVGDLSVSLYRDPLAEGDKRRLVDSRRQESRREIGLDFSNLEPGPYTVVIDAPASGAHREADVAIRGGERAELNLTVAPITVTGIVFLGNVPAESIDVELIKDDITRRVLSDSDGRYTLRVWSPGGFALLARAPDTQNVPAPEILEIPDGAELFEHDIQLPNASISGFVHDLEDGSPVPHAVVLYSTSAKDDQGVSFSLRTTTDGSGRFHLGNLQPVPIDVTVTADEYSPASQMGILPSDHDTTADFALEKGTALRGQILDSDQQPLAGALIGLDVDVAGELFQRRTTSDGTGAFEFRGTKSGAHVLFASKCGYEMAVAAIEIQPDDDARILTLVPALDPVPVRFQNSAGEPVPSFLPSWQVNGVLLPGGDTYTAMSGCGLSPRSDSDGLVDVRQLPRGLVSVLSPRDGRMIGAFANDGSPVIPTITLPEVH